MRELSTIRHCVRYSKGHTTTLQCFVVEEYPVKDGLILHFAYEQVKSTVRFIMFKIVGES